MLGQELGHYRIEGKLGEGGMGVVYKAHDTHLDRPVAIKVLSAEAVADPERKRRFVQEARTASALNHPNILHIYDIDQSHGIDFMAMEFVEGKTLHQLSGHDGLPLADALRYAGQIAGALARAHEVGIVHRDIKPANIMVDTQGLVKVLDFGLAKLTEEARELGDSALTRTVHPQTEGGVVFGTIEYMSPEQAEGRRVDARSDMFSFGMVLYEMLTGRRPFQGTSKLAILSAILSKEPVPVREISQDVPPAVEDIVVQCLRKDPGERFPSMGAVKAAIEAVQDTLRAPSTALPVPRPVARHTRRLWPWMGAAVAVALAVAIPLAWRASHSGNSGKLSALLPFSPAAADPAAQASADGLSEIIGREIAWLNQFQPAERVLPPADVRGDASLGPAEARNKLGTDLVVTGTLQRSGDKLHWTAALVRASPLREVKRVELDLSLADPVGVQSALLRNLAQLLGMRSAGTAEARLAGGNTKIPAAFEDYIQAHGWLRHAADAAAVDRAIGLFRSAIQKDAAYGRAYAGLGEALWAKSALSQDQQWPEQARQACLSAIAANAGLPDVHLVLGKIYGATGHPQEAVDEFRKTIQLDPLSIPAHTSLGKAYESLGQMSDSQTAYRALVDLWPNYLLPYSHLASFYYRQGRYQEAEPVFRKVVELAPGNATGYENLGALYHVMGRPDDAAAMMKKALSIKPSATGYTNLGTLYFFQGRYTDAVPLMEKATGMDPANYVYWGNLGDAYRWAPEYKVRAADAYKRAIALAARPNMNPNDADLRSILAVYYAKLPDQSKALAEIAQARRLAPMNPDVLFRSALAYEITGRRDQAIGALDLALQAGYSLDEARQEPDLAELRKDPRYGKIDQRASTRPTSPK